MCGIYRPDTPYYYQPQDQVRSSTHSVCTSAVFQQVHICLEKLSPVSGIFIPQVCNNPGGYVFTKTRSSLVTFKCDNTFSTRYKWMAVAWVTVSVNGQIFGSNTTITSFQSSLYCK